jgi:hypothetical protein
VFCLLSSPTHTQTHNNRMSSTNQKLCPFQSHQCYLSTEQLKNKKLEVKTFYYFIKFFFVNSIIHSGDFIQLNNFILSQLFNINFLLYSCCWLETNNFVCKENTNNLFFMNSIFSSQLVYIFFWKLNHIVDGKNKNSLVKAIAGKTPHG